MRIQCGFNRRKSMSVNLTAPSGFSASDLVFNDSFTGSSLNTKSWNTYVTSNAAQGAPWFDNGSGGSAMGDPGYDAEYDMPSQVSVNSGLTLNAVQQSITAGGVTYPFTSGVVTTYGKVEFTGGYLQISMKQPSGDGAWPALWLLPGAGAGSSGDNFEIDMQEGGMTDGSANPNDVFSGTLHDGSDATYNSTVNAGVDLSAGFNTYGIDWVPGQSITWYLNGQQVGQVTSAQTTIPDEPMELIMSNEVANSSASGWHTTMDGSTPNSMPMQVADVQLYQNPGSGETIMGSNVTGTGSTGTGTGSTGTGTGSTGTDTLPTVAITSTGGTVTSRAQTVAGTVDLADAGSTVNIYDGTTQIGTATADSNGGWTADVTLTNRGANVVTATDANAAGTGTSNSVRRREDQGRL